MEAPVEIADTAESLEGRSPADVLAWASARYAPRLTFATAFGAEGCVLLDLIARNHLPIDVFTLDTGLLFPETYALWRRLEERYGLAIRAVRPELGVEAQAAVHGPALWERLPDRCCEIRKVAPLRRALSGFDAWVSSIRREQTSERARARVVEWDSSFGLVKVNPLAAWTSEDGGYPSIGCMPCTTPVAPGETPRAGRWRGRGKTECGLHARRPFSASALLVGPPEEASAS